MESINLKCDGLFLNASAGFDVAEFREKCDKRGIIHNIDNITQEMVTKLSIALIINYHKHRFVVKQPNAWVDGFKSLRLRHETNVANWLALHAIAFLIIFIRKFNHINL